VATVPAARVQILLTVLAVAAVTPLSSVVRLSLLQLSSAALETVAAVAPAPAARDPRVLTVQAAAAVTQQSNAVLPNAQLVLG